MLGFLVFALTQGTFWLGYEVGSRSHATPPRHRRAAKPTLCARAQPSVTTCLVGWRRGDRGFNGVPLPCDHGASSAYVVIRRGRPQPWRDQDGRPIAPVPTLTGCRP